ncbi:SDR family NAD(P)-dependent oxidoreductase, partial [Sphingomonas sp. SRS2]|uniref:SDR family NAD(P)-dependent oxidoreductase n=1 Tax=Sphingomonas sp. SRS2 TaxID=133190 RepID=UPI00061846C5
MAQQQRSAIVTGASHGIGAAVAGRLTQDGLAVAINYSSASDPADALVAKIAAAGGKATTVKADVSDPAAVTALFDAAEQAFGGVGVLVNDAGVMTLTSIAEAEDHAFDETIAVNLKGARANPSPRNAS